MGLFGLFGSKGPSQKAEKKELPWQALTSTEQLEAIAETSKTKPVAIFKHSTRCGISSMVIRQFERSYEIPEGQMELFYLDLLNYREVSDEVAARFQVWHQSPQLIVIKNGTAVHDASHHSIAAAQLLRFI
jgi:bacillithiol system protein YtxJ